MSFDFTSVDWDSLVALGTGLLAIATFSLARTTRRAASAAVVASDAATAQVRAQHAPALVPVDPEVDYLADDDELLIGVVNVGRGPAMSIRAGVILDGKDIAAEITEDSDFTLRSSAVLPVGQQQDLRFRGLGGRPSACSVVLDYTDLGHHPYATRVQVGRVAVSNGRQSFDVLRVDRAQLLEGQQITPWPLPEA